MPFYQLSVFVIEMSLDMAIYIYIVRHGEAEPVTVEDEYRQLTDHGKQEAAQTGLWLQNEVPVFDSAFVSPYVRAQQTKDQIQQVCEFSALETTADIIPMGDAAHVADFLMATAKQIQEENGQQNKDTNLVCISHMPLVSYLIGELTGYTPIMVTAGVAKIKIDLDKWSGQLVTLIAPDQMITA